MSCVFTHHVGIWPRTDWRRAQSKCTSWTMELTERDIYRTPSTPLTSLLHRSCYTPACCIVLVTHLLVAPYLLHTCLLHRTCYTPESREFGRLAVLGIVTQNELLADTTCTCPIVVSHKADVHLQGRIISRMDGCIQRLITDLLAAFARYHL